MDCKRYPKKDCYNCAYSCKDETVCKDWKPDRASHPNTPNPCEQKGFPLCLNECTGCKNIID